MRVRTDHLYDAGWKRSILLGARPDPRAEPPDRWDAAYLAFLSADGGEALPGDVWIIRQPPGQPNHRAWHEEHPDWPIVGYALTCPKADCETGAHLWDHAHECHAGHTIDGAVQLCIKGPDRGCWDWTGSAADGTLSASPSLHCSAELGGCGWHGWLHNGEMSG